MWKSGEEPAVRQGAVNRECCSQCHLLEQGGYLEFERQELWLTEKVRYMINQQADKSAFIKTREERRARNKGT